MHFYGCVLRTKFILIIDLRACRDAHFCPESELFFSPENCSHFCRLTHPYEYKLAGEEELNLWFGLEDEVDVSPDVENDLLVRCRRRVIIAYM